jgi:protein-S-isoprenylcysteine O-methyltransferase Ste14
MRNLRLLAWQTLALFFISALTLFGAAGTLVYFSGWLYLALFMGFFVSLNLWLLAHNPGLFQERMHLGTSDQMGWDKFLFPLLFLSPLVWLALSAYDATRGHWSNMPISIQALGLFLLVGSFYLFFLTFRENTFLSTVVRIQSDRGHSVISTGPYHYVRHPMYAGMLLFAIGTPLVLGSWYGLLLGIGFMLILARRAILEERTLRTHLQGYADYMLRVKYRLIPYVW